jgi:transposase
MRMRQAAVEEARRKMQMKYKKEAEEAAEKNKQVSNNWLLVLQFPYI